MEDQIRSFNFVISDIEGLTDDSLETIGKMLPSLVNASNFDLKKATNGRNVLLSLDSSMTLNENGNLESKIMECFEMCGCLAHVTTVRFNTSFIFKFVNAQQNLEELFMEIQTSEVMLDQEGNVIDIETMVDNGKAQMVLIIMATSIDVCLLCNNANKIKHLSEIYKADSLESIKFIFGDNTEQEPLMNKIWSRSKLEEENNMFNGYLNDKPRKNYKVGMSDVEASQFVIVGDPFAVEKCLLIDEISQRMSSEDFLMQVDHKSKKVKIFGRTKGSLQDAVGLIQSQFKMFHFEEIPNLSRKMFLLFLENSIVRDNLEKIRIENELDGIVFVDKDGVGGVLGLNRIKTRNFIDWLGKFLVQKSLDFRHTHNHAGLLKLEEHFSLLEQGRWLSIDVTGDRVVVQGISSDVFFVLPDVESSLLKFKHYLFNDDDVIRYIGDVGIPSIFYGVVQQKRMVCLFKINEDDDKKLMNNKWKRKALYGPPGSEMVVFILTVLYEALKCLSQSCLTFKASKMFTLILIDYQTKENLTQTSDFLDQFIGTNFCLTSFNGEFDYPMVITALAEIDLIYEINHLKKVIIVFSKTKREVEVITRILLKCLRKEESKDYDEYSRCDMKNHSFGVNLDYISANFTFKIPTREIKFEVPPPISSPISSRISSPITPRISSPMSPPMSSRISPRISSPMSSRIPQPESQQCSII